MPKKFPDIPDSNVFQPTLFSQKSTLTRFDTNGVAASMPVGVFQAWKWFCVWSFGGKGDLPKNGKKKKTRKQLGIIKYTKN